LHDALPIYAALRLRSRKFRKLAELLSPAVPHRVGKLALIVGEIEKRIANSLLLAHEQQRDLRRKQQQSHADLEHVGIGDGGEPLAQCAIADLVMILQAEDEAERRETTTRTAAPRAVAIGRRF